VNYGIRNLKGFNPCLRILESVLDMRARSSEIEVI
jgi:hypothetical protein